MERFDLIVLGGGPAGYNAAERAAQAGMSTLLIEKNVLGGVCLNEGCIPSKCYLHAAKRLDHAKNSASFGVAAGEVRFDHAVVQRRTQNVIHTLVGGVEGKLKRAGVQVVSAAGTILGRGAQGIQVEAGHHTFLGRNLLIAVGSAAALPPIPGLRAGVEEGYIVTNRELFALSAPPRRLAVIGGGVVGLEMASYFRDTGSEVAVIELLDHIAGELDREVAALLQAELEKRGVVFHLSSRVSSIEKDRVLFERAGRAHAAPADRVLCAMGRRPVLEGFGLENLPIYLERGAIRTDERMRTNLPGIYAAGDINGRSMLAHTAYREGEVAVADMLGRGTQMRYHAIPSVIYTSPEAACVGETEESARLKGLRAQTAKLSMRVSGRYVAEHEGGSGICKIVVDPEYRRLLGVSMLGGACSEIIYGAGLMIETELRLEDIREVVFPHPTVGEVLREAAFSL